MINVCVTEDDFRIAGLHEDVVNRIEPFFCVGKASSAKDTIELLEKKDVHLILLDIYMPDDFGTNLFSYIREHHPSTDIIMISASTNEAHIKQSLRYGVFDYILKTDSFQRLEQTLRDYASYHEQLSQTTSFTQTAIDRLTRAQAPPVQTEDKPPAANQSLLPKGIDELSLKMVMTILSAHDGLTTSELGDQLGASRSTARRYLEYLISTKQAVARPIYGIVGRPERKYFIAD
ncbi:response regulator [Shouchella shacheensis]|uniref:response regulator n=1 Tax=Shouchella shacheensis TaxID=1649580 RepID=UPI0007403D1E|nr:response regulator [Shouchella shacheensis]